MSLEARQFDKAVELVVEELEADLRAQQGPEGDRQVGTISANNDPEIGKIISDAMEKVGKDARDHGGGGERASRPR